MNSVLTIGHSTRTLEAFIELLRAHGVARLIDVRTVPRSRRVPQFNRESLPEAFPYTHMPGLGGLRKPRKDSPNGAWRNESFRGYADYMLTPEFERALVELLAAAAKEQVAIMCAEAVPWRCHRSLISDALTARGVDALHIINAGPPQRHAMTSFARIDGTRVTYPAAPLQLGGAGS
jgi:uncharacterized protein (DUF488 family)